MMANGQIVNFAWREGIPADDVKVYYEEAKQLAVAIGDMRANALIHTVYGRTLANGGSADEYVERTREAMALAEGGTDVSVQITLKAVLCHALRTSGRMSEALQLNIEATERAHEIVKFDRQTLGFDIGVWLTAMRGQTLVMLGRGEEARPFLDRILQSESGQVDPIHYVIPSLAYVDLAWAEGDVGLAQEHADRAFSLTIRSGNPYLRVYAQMYVVGFQPLRLVEWLISCTRTGNATFLPPAELRWTGELESQWTLVRAELEPILANLRNPSKLPISVESPGDADAGRPLEVVPSACCAPSDREELREVPGDCEAPGESARSGLRHVLYPGWPEAHSAPPRSLQGTPQLSSSPARPRTSRRLPITRRRRCGRRGKRVACWSSTTPTSMRRGTTRRACESCSSATLSDLSLFHCRC